MGNILNQYSFVVMVVFFLAILAGVVFRKGFHRRGWIILAAGGLVAGLVWFGVRPQAGVSEQAEQIQQQIASATTPVLIEFQSRY